MGRHTKATVDYFPHSTLHGKTLFVLESKWGNDGYAVWFKTLEKLGMSDGHFLDCREPAELLYLAAYCRVDEKTLVEIYDTLANLNAIDPDLWRRKCVFSGNFVQGVKDAYRKRSASIPTKDKLLTMLDPFPAGEIIFPAEEMQKTEISDAGNGEREREREREREIKKENKKEKKPPPVNLLPEWLPNDRWDAFKDMRKKIKKPLTDEGERLAIAKLEQYRTEGYDIVVCLNNSIMNNWQGLFPPKDIRGQPVKTLPPVQSSPTETDYACGFPDRSADW